MTDGEYGERVIQVILSQLERVVPKEEITEKLLRTLARLSTLIPNIDNYLPRIGRLFLAVGGRASRNALVQVLQGIINNPRTDTKLKVGIFYLLIDFNCRIACFWSLKQKVGIFEK